jgi:hypothetical protein
MALSQMKEKSLPTQLNCSTMRGGDIIEQVIAPIRILGISDPDLPKKIFDALRGPEHAKHETATSNAARNLFFELRVLTPCVKADLSWIWPAS